MTECQSYNSNGMVCHDGFAQKPFCRGVAGCLQCGEIKNTELPHCLKDDGLPPHFVDDAGAPLYVSAPSSTTIAEA